MLNFLLVSTTTIIKKEEARSLSATYTYRLSTARVSLAEAASFLKTYLKSMTRAKNDTSTEDKP